MLIVPESRIDIAMELQASFFKNEKQVEFVINLLMYEIF